jgi:hypothetical protein
LTHAARDAADNDLFTGEVRLPMPLYDADSPDTGVTHAMYDRELENTMSPNATVTCPAYDRARLDPLGVADPAGTLLAPSLLVAVRPGRRSAERALEGAVAAKIAMNRTESEKTSSLADVAIEGDRGMPAGWELVREAAL